MIKYSCDACLVTRGFLDKASILVGCSHCGSYGTGLLVGTVHGELVKGILKTIVWK